MSHTNLNAKTLSRQHGQASDSTILCGDNALDPIPAYPTVIIDEAGIDPLGCKLPFTSFGQSLGTNRLNDYALELGRILYPQFKSCLFPVAKDC